MGARDDNRRVTELAARQHGNVTRMQLAEIGLSPAVIEERLEQGWLLRRHTGVFAVGHVPRTRESR